MTHPREADPLRPMLHATQSQLAERLDEACSHGVEGESTAELVRLEETLTEAARVAKQAVSLRRRLRTGHGQAPADAAAPEAQAPADFPEDASGDIATARVERRTAQPDDRLPLSSDAEDSAVREFLDRNGVSWRVWAVTPDQVHSERLTATRMGDYREGWLAFESTDGTERRRLPHFPPNWRRLTNLDLEGLLERAERARSRRPGGDDSETSLS